MVLLSRSLWLATAALVSVGVCQAQIVSPAHFTNAEGGSSYYGPFGQNSSTGWRYMQVHDDLIGQARTINSLALRRDAAHTGAYNSYSVRVTVILSHAATTPSTISTDFASNHGTGQLTVINDQLITFPQTVSSGAPAPFEYRLPFGQPFQYNGVDPLCWEVKLTAYDNLLGSYNFDAAANASNNPQLGISTFGFGCRHSTRINPMSMTATSSMNWPQGAGTLYLDGREMPAGAPVTVLLGLSKDALGAIPLPFLLPGSLAAPSGPCVLLQSSDFSFGTVASGTNARLTLPIPALAPLHGVHVFGQYVAVDPVAGNVFGIAVSNAVEVGWVAPYPTAPFSQVYATNVFAPTGTIRSNFGYVVRMQ